MGDLNWFIKAGFLALCMYSGPLLGQVPHRMPHDEAILELMLRDLPEGMVCLSPETPNDPVDVYIFNLLQTKFREAGMKVDIMMGGFVRPLPTLCFSYSFKPSSTRRYQPPVGPENGLPCIELTVWIDEPVQIPRLRESLEWSANRRIRAKTFSVSWIFTLQPDLTDKSKEPSELRKKLLKASSEQFVSTLAEIYKSVNPPPPPHTAG